jgi:hypothetical protein
MCRVEAAKAAAAVRWIVEPSCISGLRFRYVMEPALARGGPVSAGGLIAENRREKGRRFGVSGGEIGRRAPASWARRLYCRAQAWGGGGSIVGRGWWSVGLTRCRSLRAGACWRHHAFATNRTVPMLVGDIDHRDHATLELNIRDLKDHALAHFPSGQFAANSAWTVIAGLAHNLGRWATQIGLPARPVQTARARRRQLLQITARLNRTSRQWSFRMPAPIFEAA